MLHYVSKGARWHFLDARLGLAPIGIALRHFGLGMCFHQGVEVPEKAHWVAPKRLPKHPILIRPLGCTPQGGAWAAEWPRTALLVASIGALEVAEK